MDCVKKLLNYEYKLKKKFVKMYTKYFKQFISDYYKYNYTNN